MTQGNAITHKAVLGVANTIARCDFRTTISQYATGEPGAWYISVGENAWVRHIRVDLADSVGSRARLEVMSHDPSMQVTHFDELKVERTLNLSELIADGYTGVKKILHPTAAVVA